MKNEIKIGSSYYYTGDMANVGGRFQVQEIDASRAQVILTEIGPMAKENGARRFVLSRFQLDADARPNPGRRFVPWAEHVAERRAGLERLARSLKTVDEARIASMLAEFDANHDLA